jgi:hypothetical protein
MKRAGLEIELPEFSAHYLAEMLGEMGWGQPGGMGFVALSSSEIFAWSMMSDIQLEPWEFRAIRAASSAYVSQTYDETDIPPYRKEKPVMINKLKALASAVNRKK